MVVDCGVQPGGKFRPRHQVYVRWEIPSERTEWSDRNGETHEGPMNIGIVCYASVGGSGIVATELGNGDGRRRSLSSAEVARLPDCILWRASAEPDTFAVRPRNELP